MWLVCVSGAALTPQGWVPAGSHLPAPWIPRTLTSLAPDPSFLQVWGLPGHTTSQLGDKMMVSTSSHLGHLLGSIWGNWHCFQPGEHLEGKEEPSPGPADCRTLSSGRFHGVKAMKLQVKGWRWQV